MVNQPLLDFIKEQIQKGVSKDVISKQLLANGWTEEDVAEGFEEIAKPTAPAYGPLNTFIPPSYGIINLPPALASKVQKETHSSKKIFYFLLIFFLLVGGAFLFYYDLINLSIVKEILPNKTTAIKQNPPTQNTATATIEQTPQTPLQQNQVVQTINSDTVIDCGTSNQNNDGELVYKSTNPNGTPKTTTILNYKNDTAINCMGQALLNNCQKATVQIQNKGGTIHTEEILGVNNQNCVLKITYQNVNSADITEQQYANSYLQCNYPNNTLQDSACSGSLLGIDACSFFNIDKSSPAYTYISAINNMLISALFSSPKISCSGDMISNLINASKQTPK
jgi:hypothetical protein